MKEIPLENDDSAGAPGLGSRLEKATAVDYIKILQLKNQLFFESFRSSLGCQMEAPCLKERREEFPGLVQAPLSKPK